MRSSSRSPPMRSRCACHPSRRVPTPGPRGRRSSDPRRLVRNASEMFFNFFDAHQAVAMRGSGSLGIEEDAPSADVDELEFGVVSWRGEDVWCGAGRDHGALPFLIFHDAAVEGDHVEAAEGAVNEVRGFQTVDGLKWRAVEAERAWKAELAEKVEPGVACQRTHAMRAPLLFNPFGAHEDAEDEVFEDSPPGHWSECSAAF